MKSMDTNILLFAINVDCPENEVCRALVDQALANPKEWLIADQVWFELYRLLRHPAVLQSPLSAAEAASAVAWYRNRPGWAHCAWEPSFMDRVERQWAKADFPPRRIFDLVLAVTLKAQGIGRFFTRNTKDFEYLEYFEVIDPCA